MNRTIYFGPPGTGKTATLLTRLEEALKSGVPVERIAFLTFTRRARREAVERVESVLGIKARDLPHFRTIHSMAFKALRLTDGDVMGRAQLQEFGEGMGVEFGAVAVTEQAAEGLSSQSKGDHLLALDNLARLRGCSVQAVWSAVNSPYEWPMVDQFCRSYAAYKLEHGMLDFTDVLTEFVATGQALDIDVAIVDEAQDLSSLQWRAVERACASASRMYVAGDDDQAIYRWAGAEVEEFMRLEGERVVLDHSYRLPRAVHAYSCRILARIKHRVPKEFSPREGAEGAVLRHASHTSLPVSTARDGERWLWLVRNRFLLPPLVEHLSERGIVYSIHGQSSVLESERDAIYTWERLRKGRACTVAECRAMYAKLRGGEQVKRGHKTLGDCPVDEAPMSEQQLRAEHGLLAQGDWYSVFMTIPIERRSYYRRLLRTHRTLRLEPQVQLETIHGAKGAEAPHVALFLQQSRKTWEEGQRAPDEEHRVWYVGATRAREALHVVESAGQFGYRAPSGQGAGT